MEDCNKKCYTQNIQNLADQMAEAIKKLFNDEIDVNIVIDLGDKESQVEEQPVLKKFHELTIGEKFILFLIQNKYIDKDHANFDTIADRIINDPIVKFVSETEFNSEEEYSMISDFVSMLINSLMQVNFDKLVEIKRSNNDC